jgi:hypothetical protein
MKPFFPDGVVLLFFVLFPKAKKIPESSQSDFGCTSFAWYLNGIN